MIDRKTILRLRRQLPIFERYLCMNWAHSGPSPKPVLRAVQRVLEKESRHGPFHPNVWAERDAILGGARKGLAEIIGAGEDEITLTANTTNGINLAAHLFEWKRGDEVIISDSEHPGGYLPWFALRDRYGIRVRPVSIDGDDERFLDRLKRTLNPRTRMISLSHVAWLSGYRYPIRKVSREAKKRNIPLLVDGAQAAGALRVNVKNLGCDFYTISGQKWLMGPQGTGGLYVHRRLRKKLPLPAAGSESAASKDLASGAYALHPDGRRFETANRGNALYAGLAAGAEQALRIGLPDIQERILALAARLLTHFQAMSGVELLSDRRSGKQPAHSGLVTIRILGRASGAVVEELLRRHRILTREVPAHPSAVRFSVHYFNTEEEVEFAADIIRNMSQRKH